MKGHSTLWASNVPFLTQKCALCPLITLSNHLKYLSRQGFTWIFNVMNLIMHPRQNSGKNTDYKACGCHIEKQVYKTPITPQQFDKVLKESQEWYCKQKLEVETWEESWYKATPQNLLSKNMQDGTDCHHSV